MSKNSSENKRAGRQEVLILRRAYSGIRVIPVCYRFLTFLFAVSDLLFILPRGYARVETFILVGIVLFDMAVVSSPPFFAPRWKSRLPGVMVIALDGVLCIALLALSGGINSPFILYSLSPMLTGALFLNIKTTYFTAGTITALTILCFIFNPFYPFQYSSASVSNVTIYFTASCFVTALPYAINVNLRQRLEREKTLQERQRLSREIHDGVAQTLHTLCWQVQSLHQNYKSNSLELAEVERTKALAEKARSDVLSALELLRSNANNGNLVEILNASLELFKKDAGVSCSLNVAADDVTISNQAGAEIRSILQETLRNIQKHSRANNVRVDLMRVNGHYELTVTDNGCGFDIASVPSSGHFGLAMMRERAESINCRIQVISRPEQGTQVKLLIPAG
jgi:signal transduction histidine kinase